MLVFPHVPKTGGSSVRSALMAHFGNRLLLDYDHTPTREAPVERSVYENIAQRAEELKSQYSVVYGHFSADLYASVATRTAMFFRDPVDRVLSNYHYQASRGRTGVGPSPVEFARRPRQRELYLRYLGGIAIEDVDFIGITENFSQSLDLFGRMFGIHLSVLRERVGSWQASDYERSEATQAQQQNQEIYERAKARFNELCRRYL